jgi:hypothetical protein
MENVPYLCNHQFITAKMKIEKSLTKVSRNGTKYISNTGLFILLSIIMILLNCMTVSAMRNPVEAYCTALDYTYKIEEDGSAICIIDQDNSFDAAQFFEGNTGEEFNYCIQNEYEFIPNSTGIICKIRDNTYSRAIDLLNIDMGKLKVDTGCGNNICNTGENAINCPQDCPISGVDGLCQVLEDAICDTDCNENKELSDPDCTGEETIIRIENNKTSILEKEDIEKKKSISPTMIIRTEKEEKLTQNEGKNITALIIILTILFIIVILALGAVAYIKIARERNAINEKKRKLSQYITAYQRVGIKDSEIIQQMTAKGYKNEEITKLLNEKKRI